MHPLECELEREIVKVRHLVEKTECQDEEDFNLRGELYRIAGNIAPHARDNDLVHIHRWLKPMRGEKGVDVAAGTGFLTLHLAQWTQARVYAVDPSAVQLGALKKRAAGLPIVPVEGSLADDATLAALGEDAGKIDFVTSFGGLHHIVDSLGSHGEVLKNNQEATFRNVDALLRPGGRFIAADVGGGTSLARHFEESVKSHCMTGHKEKWLTPKRLHGELITGTHLKFIKARLIPIGMTFDSVEHMALFMKGLHAYDLPNERIVDDLSHTLGFRQKNGKIYLNWPLLFFHLEKQG